MLKPLLRRTLASLGYSLRKTQTELEVNGIPRDIDDPAFLELYSRFGKYSMTGPQAMFALYKALEYINHNNVPGDLVECGVWRGGNGMLMAAMLDHLGDTQRKIYLYDTYEGMTEPGAPDVELFGHHARERLQNESKQQADSVWCMASLEEVKHNISLEKLSPERFVFVQGRVEETIPNTIPDHIALLRLDTDWYESTRHELLHCYPRLASQGVLIIDDYGHWKGARKATDEYFQSLERIPLLQRIDYSVRFAIKP